MNNLNNFLNLYSIEYYPNIDYIPFELSYSSYLNNIIDHNITKTSFDITSQNKKWDILINSRYINENFFIAVHNLNINNVILPNNIICAIYYYENKKQYFWSNKENEVLYKEFL